MTAHVPDPIRQAEMPELGVLYLLEQAARTGINALLAAYPTLAHGVDIPQDVEPPLDTAQAVIACARNLVDAVDDYEQELDRKRELQLKLFEELPF